MAREHGEPGVGDAAWRAGGTPLEVVHLGVMGYDEAYRRQCELLERVVAARERGGVAGYLALVEHPAVITISHRAGAGEHLLASRETLAAMGVAVAQTDRGGDITYHGPGQLVAYPIVDLNVLNLGLHAYMRMLEQCVIDTLGAFEVVGERDEAATGVWVRVGGEVRKIAACGVRVRRWVSMHGLSLNVDPLMRHFDLIVPCGLHGRGVTSMRAVLGEAAPNMRDVERVLTGVMQRLVAERVRGAAEARAR